MGLLPLHGIKLDSSHLLELYGTSPNFIGKNGTPATTLDNMGLLPPLPENPKEIMGSTSQHGLTSGPMSTKDGDGEMGGEEGGGGRAVTSLILTEYEHPP